MPETHDRNVAHFRPAIHGDVRQATRPCPARAPQGRAPKDFDAVSDHCPVRALVRL